MSNEKAVVIHTLKTPQGEKPVWQRPTDGYVNATQICQAAGKLYANWRQQERAEEYLQALSDDIGIPISRLIMSVRGGRPEGQGTWVHPRIALRIAQWCSPKFEVQVDKWLEAYLRGDLYTDLDTNALVRMLLYPTATPWEKKFPNDFYHELSRLYNLKYEPSKRAPGGRRAAQLTDILIYSRFPEEIRAEVKKLNPTVDDNHKRRQCHHQFLKSDLQSQLDYTIDACTRIMKPYTDRKLFELAWDMFMPRKEMRQMSLLPIPNDDERKIA